MKRTIDLMASICGLALCWPVLLILIVAVRLESAGPGIFAQTRIGRRGVEFTCYKLRSMFSGTAQKPSHEVGNSSVTALGRFLRKSKLDELPQLYNVLTGDMSLVGPRPCLPSQTELIAARDRLDALTVRPGITGLAQIRGVDMSEPERLAKIDAEYARTQSLSMDMRILFSTITGVGRGVDRVGKPDPDEPTDNASNESNRLQ
jgi:O-antigen biosynthesis protein WbqP